MLYQGYFKENKLVTTLELFGFKSLFSLHTNCRTYFRAKSVLFFFCAAQKERY